METGTLPPAATTAKRTIPRELKALLLVGGALCLAVTGAWLAWYKPVSDPLPFVSGPDAVFSLSIIGQPKNLERALNALPPEALKELLPLMTEQDRRGVLTVAATPAGDGLAWNSDLGPALRRSKPRWIRRNSDGFGVFRVGDKLIPYEFRINEGFVVIRVGRTYAGLFDNVRPAGPPARLLALVPRAFSAYFYNGHEVRTWPKNSFAPYFEPLLRRLDEVAVGSATSTSGSGNRIVGYMRSPANHEARSAFFGELKRFISFVDPEKVRRLLPDGTSYLERVGTEQYVQSEEKNLSVGKITKLKNGNVAGEIFVFEDRDGGYWLGGSTDILQQAVFASTLQPDIQEACLPGGGRSGFLATEEAIASSAPQSSAVSRYIRFPLLSLVVENPETALFTICGYIGK